MFHPVIKVKIYNEDLVFVPGLTMLMSRIEQTGSMKEACAMMGMSYSKGWKIVNRAEQELHYDLIVRRHGGDRGGKCTLTEEGKSLLTRYENMNEDIRAYTKKRFREYFPEYKEQI